MNAVGLDFGLSVETHRASLKAFAMKLAGNVDAANDLVQETMLKAIEKQHQFQPGTNLKGWMFVILRNSFIAQCRVGARASTSTASRRVIFDTEIIERSMSLAADDQAAAYEAKQALAKVFELPRHHRDALLMIGVDGASYEEIADAGGVQIGTVRSRVSRARDELARQVNGGVRH
ncbi:MAG: sigma-70 family RNA polymerase sigma factor [Proteobacteria bacterium]|nr:sigma-70 family RNA polymerase sigma factor [Pseudomonadota bacterium]